MVQYATESYGAYLAALDEVQSQFQNKDTKKFATGLRHAHEMRHTIYDSVRDHIRDSMGTVSAYHKADKSRKAFDDAMVVAQEKRRRVLAIVQIELERFPD